MLRIVGKVHKHHKYYAFIGHTYQLQAMCFLLMGTIVQCTGVLIWRYGTTASARATYSGAKHENSCARACL